MKDLITISAELNLRLINVTTLAEALHDRLMKDADVSDESLAFSLMIQEQLDHFDELIGAIDQARVTKEVQHGA